MSEYHDTTVQRTETIRDQSDAEAAERAETSIHVFSEKHIHVEDDGSGTDTRRINLQIGVVNSHACRADARNVRLCRVALSDGRLGERCAHQAWIGTPT